MTEDDLFALTEARRAGKSGLARALRMEAALSQVEVADYCGIGQTAISRWETGLRAPRGEAGLRYARLLMRLRAGAPEGAR